MGMFEMFQSDKELEKTGVWFDYKAFRVLLRRAGTSNEQFTKRLEALMRPHRRTERLGKLSAKVRISVTIQALAETCIKGWEVNKNYSQDSTAAPDWAPDTIEVAPGVFEKFTTEKAVAILQSLPDLSEALIADSMELSSFQQEQLEDDAKNL